MTEVSHEALSFLVLTTILIFSGCTGRDSANQSAAGVAKAPSALADTQSEQNKRPENYSNQIAKTISIEAAMDRKIIRDADLTIEVNSTSEAQQTVTTIAESLGGFVVASEAKPRENVEPAKRTVDVKLVLRVPSTQFNSALAQIKNLGTNQPQPNVTGQDVTEEFIDLEARMKTQKALELQFVEIMKQAYKVADALEVQRQIADVRTEIEKLEGRKRFLENRSSLSTITVNIQTPMPIVVSASGFRHTVREAVSESLDLASSLVLFFVRFVIVMTPIFLFVVLPVAIVAMYFRRRAYRIRLANQLEATPATD